MRKFAVVSHRQLEVSVVNVHRIVVGDYLAVLVFAVVSFESLIPCISRWRQIQWAEEMERFASVAYEILRLVFSHKGQEVQPLTLLLYQLQRRP